MKAFSIRLAFLASICLLFICLSAQGQVRSKAVYGELLGASQGIGFSYDARFDNNVADGLGFRAGLGLGYAYSSDFVAFNISGDKVDTYNRMFRFVIPLELNYLLGRSKSKFETGAGLALCLDRYTSDSGAKAENFYGVIPYVSLGYRLVTTNGFLFRAGVLPSYNFDGGNFSFYPYLGFGWAF